MLGIQASLVWSIIFGKTAVLEEPEAKYGDPDQLDILSARELFDLLQKVQERLQEKGYTVSVDIVDKPIPVEPQTIHISKDFRILIDSLGLKEIPLRPLLRAVFILFLKHPEGILFKGLPEYRIELSRIYGRLKPWGLNDRAIQSIDDVTNPLLNSINEKCARIRKVFLDVLGSDLAAYYFIKGERGELKKIELPRDLVIWEGR